MDKITRNHILVGFNMLSHFYREGSVRAWIDIETPNNDTPEDIIEFARILEAARGDFDRYPTTEAVSVMLSNAAGDSEAGTHYLVSYI